LQEARKLVAPFTQCSYYLFTHQLCVVVDSVVLGTGGSLVENSAWRSNAPLPGVRAAGNHLR
jgi:hypothetical protein